MAENDDLEPYETGDNTMLREAMEAVRRGDRTRARDLLTRLLKADQKSATYWIWLSAVVETQKERVYCLQMALKLEPENATAKRGAVLAGALPPDDSVTPFPLNRPRSWEETLSIPREKSERPRLWSNPLVRLVSILGIAVLLVGLFVGGYMLFNPQGANLSVFITATHHATFTLSLTPSLTPVVRTNTPTFLGPTPLYLFLRATYTETPVYVLTEHPILTNSTFESGLRFLFAGEYETARVQFEQVLDSEPDAADVYYYIGESYRLEGDLEKAREAYQEAINRNLDFAPAFLGRAIVNLELNPEADVLPDLDNAISIDHQYTEAYIQRGAYLIDQGFFRTAIQDLETAIELSPGSAVAWMYLAEAQLGDGDGEAALESALKANELDLTLIPVYLTLAQAYIATGQTAQAVAVLQTYTIYEPDDVDAFLSLGTAYNAATQFEAALEVLNRYLDANPRDGEAYFQRGLAYLNMGNSNLAEVDFKKAISYDPFDFDAQLGLARSYYDQDKPGDAYVYSETNVSPLAKTDITKAQVYYWEALFLEGIGESISTLGARNSWYKLIALPEEAMPAEWRETAFEHLEITPTFTPTLRPTATSTRTRTPTP